MSSKQKEKEEGRGEQTVKWWKIKNIQAAVDGDEDDDLPGPEEEENLDNKQVQDETQEDNEEEVLDETQDDEEQQPVGTIGDHVVQEEANTYHGQKVAAVQCI